MTTVADASAAIAPLVEQRLDQLLTAEKARWAEIDDRCVEPLQMLEAFIAGGGKRLRPTFAYWGFIGAGGDPADPRIVEVGSALEMLQAFALVHDDVMDEADTRRGNVTVHRAAATDHAARQLRGGSEIYGTSVAILVGDLAQAYADNLFRTAAPDSAALWNELRVELNIGQYIDVAASADRVPDERTARLIAHYKSGRYSIERPLQLGASLTGRDDIVERLPTYGAPLGEAFQLRDDILGVFGDPALTGKPVGADLVEAKPTLLLATAFDLANESQREALLVLGDDLDADGISRAMQVIEEAGALAHVKQRIEQLSTEALTALGALDLADDAPAALEALAHFMVTRDH